MFEGTIVGGGFKRKPNEIDERFSFETYSFVVDLSSGNLTQGMVRELERQHGPVRRSPRALMGNTSFFAWAPFCVIIIEQNLKGNCLVVRGLGFLLVRVCIGTFYWWKHPLPPLLKGEAAEVNVRSKVENVVFQHKRCPQRDSRILLMPQRAPAK